MEDALWVQDVENSLDQVNSHRGTFYSVTGLCFYRAKKFWENWELSQQRGDDQQVR